VKTFAIAINGAAPVMPTRSRAVTDGFATLLAAAAPVAEIAPADAEPSSSTLTMTGGDVATSSDRTPEQAHAAKPRTTDATDDVIAATAAAALQLPAPIIVARPRLGLVAAVMASQPMQARRAAAPKTTPPPIAAEPVRTPLEQAVIDLLAKLPDTAQPAPAVEAAPTAPIAQPEAMQSTTHAHIVMGEDGNRVVMTVAVRGANVNVTLKVADEQVAAALARNAGVLDDAMRGRGLELDTFDAERESGDHEDEREPTDSRSNEPFELEETV